MKIRSLLGCLLFIGFGVSLAQEVSVRKYPMSEHSLLWKVSGDSVAGEAYLFGTIHLIEKKQFFFPKKLRKITESLEILVMEIAGMPDASEIQKYLMLDSGSMLDPFSELQRDSIYAWIDSTMHFNKESFDAFFGKMKPFIIVQLATQLSMKGEFESYELTFEEIAKEAKLELRGLETAKEQIDIFDGLSTEETVQMVMESIRDDNEAKETRIKMNELYLEQDLDGLYNLITEKSESVSSMEKRLLIDRNKKWIPKLKEYVRSGNLIIAVGAGHLGGPEGVIRLMEKQGYTLTPVKL